MKTIISLLFTGAAMLTLTACGTTYSHNNNHYCSSSTWNGTRCVNTNNHPVVVSQPVVVRHY